MKVQWLQEPRSLGGPKGGSPVLGAAFAIAVTGVAFAALRFVGLPGLVMVFGGLVGAVVTVILMIKHPIVVCIAWFFAMSGMQTQGMIRMPGLPDFSLARLFMVLTLVLVPVGIIRGKHLLKRPFAIDILVIGHAVYVLFNMYVIGDGLRLNTWIASSLAPVIGYLFAKQYITEERQLKVLFGFFVTVSLYFWITCVGERFDITAIVWPKSILNRDIGVSWYGRSRGPFLQPALTGQMLGWYIMVQLFLLTRRMTPAFKLLLVVNIAMCAVGMLFTYTRGPWLATAVGLVVMGALRPSYRKLVVGAGVAGALLLATDFLQPGNDEFLEERLATTNTIDNRLGFFATATRMIQEKPLFGVGYFQYLKLAPQYNQGTYIPFYGFVKKEAGANVAIHDIYIGRAAEEGLVSLAMFLGLIGAITAIFRLRWREVEDGGWFDRDFLGLAAGVCISYLVLGLIIDHRYFDLINVIPLFFAAVVAFFPTSRETAVATRAVRANAPARRTRSRGAI